jgi:hypothetical protein
MELGPELVCPGADALGPVAAVGGGSEVCFFFPFSFKLDLALDTLALDTLASRSGLVAFFLGLGAGCAASELGPDELECSPEIGCAAPGPGSRGFGCRIGFRTWGISR